MELGLMKRIYHSKLFPRIFYKKPDGGEKSGVTGYFLIEWKCAFSIGILKFNKGSREAFHNHAFNALTWWLKGSVTEERHDGGTKDFGPSFRPKYTPRDNCHRIIAKEPTYAFTIRGPWLDYWHEIAGKVQTVFTHGRQVVDTHDLSGLI